MLARESFQQYSWSQEIKKLKLRLTGRAKDHDAPSTFLPVLAGATEGQGTGSDTAGTAAMQDCPINRLALGFISRYRAKLSAGLDL